MSGSLLRSALFWAIGATVVLAAILYYPLFSPEAKTDLTHQGELFFFEANEAAGAPVLMLAAWLFYRRSHYMDLLRGKGSVAAASMFFLITAALYGWGAFTEAPDIQLASSMPLLAGIVSLLGGRIAMRAYWLPIVFLGFALPISPVLLSAVIYSIQLVTAQYAGLVLNLIGVASYVQGDQILRPENTFVVIETCSGVRTIVTLTMLTILLIDLFERRGRHAAILIMLAPVVAFLTNGLRVVTLVLNPYSDVASIHNLQGIVMLLVGLTAIYLLDHLLERFMTERESQARAEELDAIQVEGVSDRVFSKRMLAVLGVLVLMLGLRFTVKPYDVGRYVDETTTKLLDRAFADWESSPIKVDYGFLGTVHYLTWEQRRVKFDGGTVDVMVAVGEEQHRKETILTPRLAWPSSGHEVLTDEMISIGSDGDGINDMEEMPDMRRLVLRRGAKSVLSYSWYEHAGGLATEWFRQAAALDRSPLVRSRHILAVRLSTNLGSGAEGAERAERRIKRVYERLAPELENFAPVFPPQPAVDQPNSVSDTVSADF